ncbi:MAG: AMMECR1 domain-containing protein [Candidatus Aenigmarchaeota archaeon ex4484_224]|nr:MAG: AMMECR1 domain-containing protein [Candidatus Aenigmarchaeota archaeon ex4484_224]
MDLETGEWIVKFARKVIEATVNKKEVEIPKKYPKELNEKRGAFVTIQTYPEKELRGCIGLPYPMQTLLNAIIEAGKEVCFDPRFPPLKKEELKKITVEVSILTEPKIIQVKKPEEYLEKIEIGKDGLIVVNSPFSGLLLPQVPIEYNWNAREFLRQTCLKAGLPPNCWQFETTKILKFQAEIFRELEPNGKVIKVELKKD